MELWNEANGIPRYDVSSWGQVFDKQKFRLLKQTPDKAGYLRVKLWIAGERKTVSVHRLVADAFYACGVDGWEVNHIDGDRTNNHVVNLELTTRSGNMIHAFERGLAEPCYAVTRVRIRETGQIFPSTGAVDRYLGVSPGSVSKTLRGLQPTCKGYTFERIGGEAHDS
nr:MAG TPA: hypothetical protein [Siphovirus LN-2020-2]